MVFLSGCSGSGLTASPTLPPSAASATPVLPTEPLPTPERTFVVIGTVVPVETVVEVTKPTPESPYIADLVQQAKQDLAKRLNVPVETIELVQFEDMVWPDGALGCPEPGMAYIQVMVEGYRIQLQLGGQIYNYHGGGSNPPFLCQNPQ